MKKLYFIFFIIVIMFTSLGCTNTLDNQLSKREKKQDFEYFYKVIEESYPFLEVNKRLNNLDWLSKKEEYLNRVTDTKNDDEFIRVMSSIIYELNNKHTHLIKNKDEYDFLKDTYSTINYFDFWDEKLIENRYEDIGSISSNKGIQSTNSSPTDNLKFQDVIDNEIGYIHIPSMQKDEDYLKAINNYLDTLDNHKALIIDIRGNNGGSDLCWMNIVSKLAKDDIISTGYMLFRENNPVISNYLKNRNYNTEPINNLPSKARKNMPPETLDLFTGFSKTDRIFYKNINSKFKGNIYLLVDKSVYSSSESFSIFCKNTGFATIIGETTSGDGGGMDPVLFYLKNSGLIIRMSSDMYITSDGTCNEEFKTTPDYEIDDCTIADDINDDNCINKVLELEKIQ